MNKKRLSVVMAGAMLASSVAPVLAAEVENKVELTAAQKGELANSLTEKIWAADRFSEKDTNNDLKGVSIYGIQINDEKEIAFADSHSQTGSEAKLEAAIKAAFAAANGGKGLLVGDVVKLVNLGTEKRTVDGKEELFSQFISSTYTKEEVVGGERVDNSIEKQLEDLRSNEGFKSIVNLEESGYDSKEGGYVITFKTGVNTFNGGKPLVIKEGTTRYNFNYYKNDKGNIYKFNKAITTVDNFRGFLTADPKNLDIPETVVEATEITSGGDTYKLSDLYDGLFLTTKGYELLNNAKEVESILLNSKNLDNHGFGDFIVKVDNKVKGHDVNQSKNANGKYQVEVEIANPISVANYVKGDTQWVSENTKYDKYTITADSVRELETLVKWLDTRDAAVDKIEGEDRYTTAVRLAKEVGLVGRKANDGKVKTTDIVLVNGRSLVDGLAAAPLAGHLKQESKHNADAPILLTATNELPKVTQRYLRELIDLEGNKDLTVHIVGGESVVSNNVKKQLRALGLNVERYAGEDREETSMAVAKEIGFENGAFVIGARGEADAMSISGLAASTKAPVVVSGFGGLSEETIDALDGVRVNVIGGESRISKAEYEEVAAVAESIRRVHGEDRKATNAAVINTFYKDNFVGASKAVIVAKDDELVDALASANLASVKNAPIVLGRKSLTKEQIHAVVQNADTAEKVYQIGGQVERNVVKVVAEALKLVNSEK